MMGLVWMWLSSWIRTPFLPCICWSIDWCECAGAAAFGSRPRLGLQAVNVAEIDLVNGDYRRGLECRFT